VRTGLLGGTFDPIHLGHLRAAECAREALALEAVVLVPAGVPPHRQAPQASALDRFAMVSLASAENPRFVASDVELRRQGPSYTVETLSELRAERPDDELVLIVGADTLPEMASWREAGRVFSLCEVAVVTRPGAAQAQAGDGRRVSPVAGPALDISSSAIRQLVREGRSVRYLVPPAVADYIDKRGLYL
jgi:nicotinate-nucleotide adenylyltransferase